MRKLVVSSPLKIKKAIPRIKDKIDIFMDLKRSSLTINGNEFEEFTVAKIVEAIDFGFEIDDALMLLKDDRALEYVNMKEHTHRKNLMEIRSRVIGTEGKAKQTIENLTDSVIVIHNNVVGIIADTAHMPYTIQGIISLVQGAKHGNVFSYIERQNANLRKIKPDELGLRDPQKDLKNLD